MSYDRPTRASEATLAGMLRSGVSARPSGGLQPSGTVTFAFTDIEGSTVRWERDRAAMQDAVRRHDAILRAAITEHGGYIFKTIGDAFCCAFAEPQDAVTAMLAAQQALAIEDFAAVDGLRVRAALHTGTADEREGDYFGPPLNKVARLLATGHGGQILLTGETAEIVEGALPAGVSLRDLGTYHLKDFVEPQRVHQLLAPVLQVDFPPLRSLGTLPSDLFIVDAAQFHPVPNFDGREDELLALHAALDRDEAIAVVHGMGGVGKSSIVREYGWRSRERYSVVWWLNAQTEDGIIDCLLRLGATFVHGLDQLDDRRAAAQRVLHSVLGGFDRPVLLVFDNLEDEQLMRTWLPRSGTRAVVTSRHAAWSTDMIPIALQPWSLDAATRYLLRSSGRDDLSERDACAIAGALGALPLALSHAAAALRNLRMVSVQRYLERINEYLRKAPRGADYPRSVFATFSTAIAQAEQHAAGAAAVLCFAASFAPDALPDELFRQGTDSYSDDLRPMLSEGAALDLRSAVVDEFRLDEALGTLDRLSLMTFNRNSSTYNVHRLVQLAARDLADGTNPAWTECAVRVADAAFPDETDAPIKWLQCERLLPHARTALDGLPSDTAFLPAGQLAYRCSRYLNQRGEHALAVQMGKRALSIAETALGPDHLDVARSLNVLALVYWDQGLFAAAESLLTRALAIRERSLGPDHPLVADSLTSLALTYGEQAQYAEAERLHSRALSIREAALGPADRSIAPILSNLAVVYEHVGRYADASALYARALEIWENALGPGHPRVASGLNNLAGTHRQRGRARQAEPLCLRSVAIREDVLGPDHPELAMSLNVLAKVYADQGRFAEAEEGHLRALAIREKAFGPDRPDVAQTLNNLADLYRLQERYVDAEPLLARAISIRGEALGPEHPELAESLSTLADVYRCQGRCEDAQPLIDRALAIREKRLGPDHPNTAVSLEVLALIHADHGRFAESEATHLRALATREKVFDEDHPDVALSLSNLANLYRLQGRFAEAQPLLARALSIREKALPPEHPLLRSTREALAALPVTYFGGGLAGVSEDESGCDP